MNLGPLLWKLGVLATGLPGESWHLRSFLSIHYILGMCTALFFPVCAVALLSCYCPNNHPSLSPPSQFFFLGGGVCQSHLFLCHRRTWSAYDFKSFHRCCCCLESHSRGVCVCVCVDEGEHKKSQFLSHSSGTHQWGQNMQFQFLRTRFYISPHHQSVTSGVPAVMSSPQLLPCWRMRNESQVGENVTVSSCWSSVFLSLH